ncbi:MAG: hypothetical protein GY835_25275 [bacterium]|nr:hypothetical protein [bacterium]
MPWKRANACFCSRAEAYSRATGPTGSHDSGANTVDEYCGSLNGYSGGGGKHVFSFTLATSQEVTIQVLKSYGARVTPRFVR